MTTIFSRFRHCERGANAVEMALVMLTVIILIIGMVEFAVAYWVQHTLLLAVEEVSRYAIVNKGISATAAASDVCQVLTGSTTGCTNIAAGGVCNNSAAAYCVNATTSNATTNGTTTTIMKLTASYGFNLIGLTGSSITLTGQTAVPLD